MDSAIENPVPPQAVKDRATLDPAGADVGRESPYPDPPEPLPPFHAEFGSPEATEMVEVDGAMTPLALFPGLASLVSQCPSRGCGAMVTENGFEFWNAFADGYDGYMPMGGSYAGGGMWSWETEAERNRRQGIFGNGRVPKPTLKRVRKPTKAEVKAARAIAETGVFDNEADDMVQRLLNAADIVKKYVRFVSHRDGGLFEKKENRDAVRQSLIWLLADPECEKAFKDNNLTTPAEVIKKRGSTLAGAGILLDPTASREIGIPEVVRQAAQRHVDNLKNQAFTIDIEGQRLFTFFKNRAFEGASILFGRYSIEEIVVHESIHMVGEKKHPSWLGGHDLSGHPAYYAILAKCRIDKW